MIALINELYLIENEEFLAGVTLLRRDGERFIFIKLSQFDKATTDYTSYFGSNNFDMANPDQEFIWNKRIGLLLKQIKETKDLEVLEVKEMNNIFNENILVFSMNEKEFIKPNNHRLVNYEQLSDILESLRDKFNDKKINDSINETADQVLDVLYADI